MDVLTITIAFIIALLFIVAPIGDRIINRMENTPRIVFLLILVLVLGFTGILPEYLAWISGVLIILSYLLNKPKLHSQLSIADENPDIITKLLATGLDVNARDRRGWTPLHDAATSNKNPEVIQLLLNAGADMNALGRYGSTPLHEAAAFNTSPKIIQLLLDSGLYMNAKDKWGQTPLHVAAWHNKNPEIVIELLKYGANAKLRDTSGKTAFERAKGNRAIRKSPAYQALKSASE